MTENGFDSNLIVWYPFDDAESAFADACRPGNPRDTSVEEIVELYKSQL